MANAGTLTVQLPGVGEFRLDEWVHGVLFSSVNYNTNQSATIDAFSYIRGQTVPDAGSTATERNTNAPQAGFLPIGWEMLVYSHQIRPRTAMGLADIQDIEVKCNYVLRVGRNPVYEGPLSSFPCGGGVHIFTTANATTVVNNGTPDPQSKRAFLIPVHIREQKQFAVENRFPAALSLSADDQLIHHFLEGLLKRPIDTT